MARIEAEITSLERRGRLVHVFFEQVQIRVGADGKEERAVIFTGDRSIIPTHDQSKLFLQMLEEKIRKEDFILIVEGVGTEQIRAGTVSLVRKRRT